MRVDLIHSHLTLLEEAPQCHLSCGGRSGATLMKEPIAFAKPGMNDPLDVLVFSAVMTYKITGKFPTDQELRNEIEKDDVIVKKDAAFMKVKDALAQAKHHPVFSTKDDETTMQ